MQPIIKSDRVHLRTGAPRRRPAAPAPEASGEAERVHPVLVDGVVRALEVRCACGQISVVELDYETPENQR